MSIRVQRRAGPVTITLDRPEKKNALDAQTWIELDRELTEVANDPDDRALMLTGAGGNFSAGADLSGGEPGKGLMGRRMQPIVQEMRAVGEIIVRLQRLPKPTLAKVDGVAGRRRAASPGACRASRTDPCSLPGEGSRYRSSRPLRVHSARS